MKAMKLSQHQYDVTNILKGRISKAGLAYTIERIPLTHMTDDASIRK